MLLSQFHSQNWSTDVSVWTLNRTGSQEVQLGASLLYVVSDNMLISVGVNNTAELSSFSGEYMAHVG